MNKIVRSNSPAREDFASAVSNGELGISTAYEGNSGRADADAYGMRPQTGGDRPAYAPGWDIAGSLWRHKVLSILVAGLCMAGFTAVLMMVPASYKASSLVIFQGDRPSAVRDDGSPREAGFSPDTLANEIEMILSEEVLARAASRLDLLHDTDYARSTGLLGRVAGVVGLGPADVTPSPAVMQAEQTAELRSRLSVGPVGLSRVIRITGQASTAARSAAIANGVAAAYIDTLLESRKELTGEAHRWIEQRLDELRDRASRSAVAFEAIRHANGILRGKDSTIRQEQITQVSSDLTQARQLRASLDQVLAETSRRSEADLDKLSSQPGSELLSKLREQLAQATSRRAELEARGGARLPAVVAIRAQVADIGRSIGSERDRARQTLRSRAAVAAASEQRLAAELEDLKSQIELSESSLAQMQALERDATADATLYSAFRARARQTDPELNYQSPSARLLSSAVAPLRAASPNKRVLMPAALLVSLGIGAFTALAKEGRRRGVHSLQELPRPKGQAPLGMLPFVRRRDGAMSRVWDEGIAQILARLMLPPRGVAPASILVTSALPREGKTRVAIALATAARQRGLRVVLVDADLRRRAASEAAGLSHSDHSLVRLLRGEIAVEQAAVFHDAWGFAVLPAGASHESPMRLLATDGWEGVLRDLEILYDLVIVDTPPVLAAGDTWLLARYADATVVVSEWGATPLPSVELAVEQLTTGQAKVAGLVLTKVAHREHAGYGYDDSVLYSRSLLSYHTDHRRLR